MVGDGFAEVVAAIVADYDAGEMPMPGTEDFAPAFKKWIKVQPAPSGYVHPSTRFLKVHRIEVAT